MKLQKAKLTTITSESPKIAIFGVGSVTVTIIFALMQNKVPFKILCKKERENDLKNSVFQFTDPKNKTHNFHLENQVSVVNSNADSFDYIIIGCKSKDRKEYVDLTKKNLTPNGKWILIQNGLPEEGFLENKMIGGVVGWNTQKRMNGDYYQPNIGSLILGSADGSKVNSEWKFFLEPYIPVVLTNNLIGVRWHKLAINSIINGLAASKKQSLGELFLNISSRNEAIQTVTEIKNLMIKMNIQEEVVPGSISIIKLGDGVGSLPGWLRHIILIFLGLKYYKIRTSMVQDLDNGRKTEISDINGKIVEKAKHLSLSAPMNDWICKTVKQLEMEGVKL
ncbi:ketopantoate reductase C-terminal domain-containing protein [Leptospira sp. 96542]|nr:ketopantoate reductase C-terminal domain-containing protein [Leptospira sp. 96542]